MFELLIKHPQHKIQTQNQEASPHFSGNTSAEMLRNESMNLWRIPSKPKIASGVIELVLPFLDHGGN